MKEYPGQWPLRYHYWSIPSDIQNTTSDTLSTGATDWKKFESTHQRTNNSTNALLTKPRTTWITVHSWPFCRQSRERDSDQTEKTQNCLVRNESKNTWAHKKERNIAAERERSVPEEIKPMWKARVVELTKKLWDKTEIAKSKWNCETAENINNLNAEPKDAWKCLYERDGGTTSSL